MKNSYLTVTDQFCGAGGSSLGATKAGVSVKLALNHWKLAIQTHNTNFPNVDHDCTDISAVDPRRYASTDILITSPECTNHSIAKGKARTYYTQDLFGNVLIDPAEERSRATMWDVPRFAEYHDYNIIIVENVVDAGKWRLFESWLHAMHALGYDHQVVYLNSMFALPTPQSRDRMYTVFWKKNNPKPNLDIRPLAWCNDCQENVQAIQTWKKRKQWGKYKTQYFYRCPKCNTEIEPYYYAALNAIDFSIKAERIGDRKKPLKPKTLARIEYGLEAYGRKPLLLGDEGLHVPWIIETGFTHGKSNRSKSALEPMNTETTRQTLGIAGFISKQYGGKADPKYLSIPLSDPLGTVTTADHHALLSTDFIAELHGTSKASPTTNPLMCITTNGSHHALISPNAFLQYYYSGSDQVSGMNDPIYTVTGLDRAGLVQILEKLTVDDLTFRMLQPHELGAAMAFPSDYVVLGTHKEKCKQYGNAVTPPAMEILIERCVETFQ